MIPRRRLENFGNSNHLKLGAKSPHIRESFRKSLQFHWSNKKRFGEPLLTEFAVQESEDTSWELIVTLEAKAL